MPAIADSGKPDYSPLARPDARDTLTLMERRDPLKIINAIEAIQSRNNRN